MADINLGKVKTHSAQNRDTGATARRWPIISRRTCHPTRRRRRPVRAGPRPSAISTSPNIVFPDNSRISRFPSLAKEGWREATGWFGMSASQAERL